jgi:hypothetical protein
LEMSVQWSTIAQSEPRHCSREGQEIPEEHLLWRERHSNRLCEV